MSGASSDGRGIQGKESPQHLPYDASLHRRVQMTVSCRDSDPIPKVPEAGQIATTDAGVDVQVMHNGIKIVRDCYCGPWMTEIIRRLHGHHEPQEERLFHEVVGLIPDGGTMIELGGYWSYYSLWFHHVVSNAVNFVVEPDPNLIRVGKANFALNGSTAKFAQYCIGRNARRRLFRCESDNRLRWVRQTSIDDFLDEMKVGFVDLLHADIQGAELELLRGAKRAIGEKRIRFLFLSTHHHSISGDPLTHQRCLDYLRESGAIILAEHTVSESYSGDGLIVASFDREDAAIDLPPISYNRACNSLFPETEYDLRRFWIASAPIRKALSLLRKPF